MTEYAARFVGVGIGEYAHYGELQNAANEVREIADSLRENGIDACVVTATEETELIKELKAVLPPADRGQPPLVLYWAGHGEPAPEAGLRLIAKDTAENETPLLTAEYLASRAVRSGSRQILLIFDTCYSGAGALEALRSADKVLAERTDDEQKAWLGVVASAREWEKARDGLFGKHFIRLLTKGPTMPKWRRRWTENNAGIDAYDLLGALQAEWGRQEPHQLKVANTGDPQVLLPNLRFARTPPTVVEHLLNAARGGEPDDERWYFTGRTKPIDRLVASIRCGQPGLNVVTGPPGCGKSAILGMVVCLSDPEQRKAIQEHYGQLPYADPGEKSVHANVYASRLALEQLVRELDQQLSDHGVLELDRRGQRGPGELLDAVRASPTSPAVIVVDGLDEAGVEAWPIVEDVLRPLARSARLLVGTREQAAPDGGTSLVPRLQSDESAVIRLPDEDDATDVRAYVLQRLAGHSGPTMDARLVADAVPEVFLTAKTVTAQLRAEPIDTSQPDWQKGLASNAKEAFDQGLVELPEAATEMLVGLSWAQGAGFPDDIWAIVATALSRTGTTYTRDDVFRTLTVAGQYVVEARQVDHAAYRLAHQELADHLRKRTRMDGDELRIATALSDAYHELLSKGFAPKDRVYLARYFWRHCADADLAGIDLLRTFDEGAFLSDLALAHRYLAERLVERGQPVEATAPAKEAAELYRKLGRPEPTLGLVHRTLSSDLE